MHSFNFRLHIFDRDLIRGDALEYKFGISLVLLNTFQTT